MRCIFFKSDTLYKFSSEICFSNGIFRFQLNYYQTATNIKEQLVGKRRQLDVKNFFYERVVCVCLTFGAIFLGIAFFKAPGFLMGVMTISFALPIDLHKSLLLPESG